MRLLIARKFLLSAKMLHKVIVTALCCMALLIGFSGEAQAIRYNYYLNPGYDNAPIWYVDTTSTTATMAVGSQLWGDGWDYYSYPMVVTCDKYLNPYWDDPYWIMRAGGGAHWGSPIPREWSTRVLMTGLTPGTVYTLVDQATGASQFGLKRDTSTIFSLKTYTIMTEHVAPTSPTFVDITQNTVTVNWTKNGNGAATYYKLYRGASATGPWTLLYDGAGIFYADSGLVPNTKYYYRIGSYTSGQAERYATIMSLTTSEDPAVAASTAAKESADAALAASESVKTSVNTMTTEFQLVKTDITAIKASIEVDLMPPTITKFVYITPYITALKADTADFILEVYDNKTEPTNLSYRYRVNNDLYSDWVVLSSSNISINVGSTKGVKLINIEVRDGAGRVSNAVARLWRL